MKFFWIFLGAAFNVLGDILLKRWSLGKTHIAWGLASYVIDAFIWAKILKDGNDLGSSLVIWETVVILMAVGWVVWKEGESISPMSLVGMFVAMAGVFLIEYGHD
jgi:hypothetical protein